MFGNIMSSNKSIEEAPTNDTKRNHARRSDDRCISIVNGQMHPVENWSSGGMLVQADDKLFAMNQECVFTLKFKLRDEIMEIDHKAKVIRKTANKIALQFMPLTKKVSTDFQKVVDDFVSNRFADSQNSY